MVKSLVDDVIMPPIGYVISGVDFKDKSWPIKDATYEVVNGVRTMTKPPTTLNYGAFINNVITFMIVAWAVFMLVKAMNVAETRLRLGQQPRRRHPAATRRRVAPARDSRRAKNADR